jgi:hypothetical protein
VIGPLPRENSGEVHETADETLLSFQDFGPPAGRWGQAELVTLAAEPKWLQIALR